MLHYNYQCATGALQGGAVRNVYVRLRIREVREEHDGVPKPNARAAVAGVAQHQSRRGALLLRPGRGAEWFKVGS